MLKERTVVHDLQTYINIIRAYNGKADCYASLYSLPQIERNVYDTLYLDIDGSGYQDAFAKLEAVLHLLAGYNYRVYWSGRRGFHIYIDFPPTHLHHPALTMKQFLSPLKEYVDPHTRGNIRQMCRIPYTIHPKTGQKVVRIYNMDSPIEDILIPKPEGNLALNESLPRVLVDIDSKIKEESFEAAEIVVNVDSFPQCIVNILVTLAETGDLSHQGRLHLTAVLLWAGFSPSDIHSILKSAKDYRPEVTEYQIAAIKAARLKGYSCIRLREFGLCPLEDLDILNCEFYPSINMYLLDYGRG